MDYSNIALFSIMKTKMSYLGERQRVLSGNIARADIPGAKAEDLKPLDFHKLAMITAHRLDMRTTSSGHIATGANQNGEDFRTEKKRKTFETTPMKNNIVIEEQQGMVAQNTADYQLTANLYEKTRSLIKISLGAQE